MGQFKRVTYPDGQISAIWEPGQYDSNPLAVRPSVIKERINSYQDLFYIRAIADIIQGNPNLPVYNQLFIPCMFGQRSDRRFQKFQSFDLKLICDVINECSFRKVEIFDPHSDVCLALINNSVKASSFEYVESSVKDIFERQLLEDGYMTDLLLVSPDAGAYKKVFEYGEKLNLPVAGAMKHRDKGGNLSMIFSHNITGKDCLIIDDLCDGGATFLSLGVKLKEEGARKIYLYISHGLFSRGFETLTAVIDHIYCTNSIRDEMEQPFLTQYKII